MGRAELESPAGAAPAARPTTVLCAEVGGAPQDAARSVNRYLQVLGQAATLSGGRVLHTHANGVLALFSTPDAAAAAAARMHTYTQTLPPEQPKLEVRIGFHAGPVGQRNEDIFGDTVNLALQLAGEAKDGQVLTSHDTASSLAPAVQGLVRPARGKNCKLLLGKLEWQDAVHQIVSACGKPAAARAVLRLTYRGKVLVRRREADCVWLGRDANCDLSIDDGAVSRRHCTILRRDASFILRDRSTNGTLVTVVGQSEVHVHGRELPLGESGVIAFGQSGHSVRYKCESQN